MNTFSTATERKAFWDRLCSDASGLLHALHDTGLPAEYKSERYVVKAYHHPELLRALTKISKEAELLDLIEEHLKLPWKGSSAKLDSVLREFAARRCDQLFNLPNACGVMLSRLAKLYPERITRERSKDGRQRCIKSADNAGDA